LASFKHTGICVRGDSFENRIDILAMRFPPP
jgi:hypothetical protein